MYPAPRQTAWLVASTGIISAGMTIAVIQGFRGRFLPVYGGILVFIAGYWLAHRTLSGKRSDAPGRRGAIAGANAGRLSFDTALFLGGSALLSYGFYTFLQTVVTFDGFEAAGAGALILVGYILTHAASKNTVI